MFRRHRRCCLSSQIVQLDSGYTRVQPVYDLFRDLSRVDVLHVESIAEFGDARCDFVKVDVLFTAIYRTTI